MIEIDWEKEKEKIKTPFNELEDGYYLLKDKTTKENIILSMSNKVGQFHKGIYIVHENSDYPNFYSNYKIIGKIKNMKITDIELE